MAENRLNYGKKISYMGYLQNNPRLRGFMAPIGTTYREEKIPFIPAPSSYSCQ